MGVADAPRIGSLLAGWIACMCVLADLLDPLMLSRIQFALTIGFHFLFPPSTIGLAWLLVVVEYLGWRRGDETTFGRGGSSARSSA